MIIAIWLVAGIVAALIQGWLFVYDTDELNVSDVFVLIALVFLGLFSIIAVPLAWAIHVWGDKVIYKRREK